MAYAKDTDIAFERSIADIVTLLRAAGADEIAQVEGRYRFQLQFGLGDRVVRFRVHFPDAAAIAARTGPRQDPARVAAQWRRQRGRALLLVIKAKLESVESEVETFEQAFLANIVLPGGKTVDELTAPQIEAQYRDQAPGALLLGGPKHG